MPHLQGILVRNYALDDAFGERQHNVDVSAIRQALSGEVPSHRARQLAQKLMGTNCRVLYTTFNKALAQSAATLLDSLCGPERAHRHRQRLRHDWLCLRSGLRPSLRHSQSITITQFSHDIWYKNWEGVTASRHRWTPGRGIRDAWKWTAWRNGCRVS